VFLLSRRVIHLQRHRDRHNYTTLSCQQPINDTAQCTVYDQLKRTNKLKFLSLRYRPTLAGLGSSFKSEILSLEQTRDVGAIAPNSLD